MLGEQRPVRIDETHVSGASALVPVDRHIEAECSERRDILGALVA